MRNKLWIALAVAALAGCGDDTPKKSNGTAVVEEPKPEDAVAAAKLKWEKFRGYYYCELSYPRPCDDLPLAYVLPREGSDPMRIVFFNNQERTSTWAMFDYATWDPDTGELLIAGHFQWREFAGNLDRQGKALWGIPE